MPQSYYDLLHVGHGATPDEIKHAFRREIAKYHPDKVQHLGQEFQEIAATKAAELTQAYKTLTDTALRQAYDEQLEEAPDHRPPAAPPSPRPAEQAERPAPSRPSVETPAPQPGAGSASFSEERAGASEVVRRAVMMRFRHAIEGEFSQYDAVPVKGFEVSCVPKPAFWSLKLPPRLLGRYVERVDGPAVVEAWGLAGRMKKDRQRDLCVFLLGPAVAPAGELAAAIAEQRRKPLPAGGKLIMVPVNTRTWAAHVPADSPPAVRAIVGRLKAS